MFQKRILLVEDEAMVAMDIEYGLLDRGADVIGPVGTLEDTLDIIKSTTDVAAAILDVRICGEEVYPAAQELADRNIPILFHTGHASEFEIRKRFPDAPVVMKPQTVDLLLKQLETLIPE